MPGSSLSMCSTLLRSQNGGSVTIRRRKGTSLVCCLHGANPIVPYFTRHLSLTPRSVFAQDAHGSQIKAEVAPIGDEPVIFKNVNSAFIGTTLEQQLHGRKITQLVIVGLTTDHCVSTTTRMAGNLGFEVYLVSDGTATFERIGPNGKHYSADEIHEVNLASLHGEFAEGVCTDGILANLTVVAAEV